MKKLVCVVLLALAAVMAAQAVSPTRWSVDRVVNRMDDTTSIHLFLRADNAPGDFAVLFGKPAMDVTCNGGIAVFTGAETPDPGLDSNGVVTVRLRLDGGKPITQEWNSHVLVGNNAGAGALSRVGMTVPLALSKAHRLLFEFTSVAGLSVILEFTLDGMGEALHACNTEDVK